MKHLLVIATAIALLPFASAEANRAAPAMRDAAADRTQEKSGGATSGEWSPSRRIEGVWDERVTITNCTTGDVMATFRSTDMFTAGGALTDTNSMAPTSRGPGAGVWRHTDGPHFGAAMRFFRYAPDGTFAGVQDITRDIVIDASGDALTGTVSVRVLGPDDELLQTACGTEEATRVDAPGPPSADPIFANGFD